MMKIGHSMRTPEELAEEAVRVKFKSLALQMLWEVRLARRRPRIRGRIQQLLLQQQSQITGMRFRLQDYALVSLSAMRQTDQSDPFQAVLNLTMADAQLYFKKSVVLMNGVMLQLQTRNRHQMDLVSKVNALKKKVDWYVC